MPTTKTPRWRTVRTQAELDKVVEAGDFAEIVGDGYFTAFGSATVSAYDSATVSACDSATVRATPFTAVHKLGKQVKVSGTKHIIEPPDLTDRANWLAYYGLKPNRKGIVVLYKSVKADFHSGYGADYSPGATPEAADWRDTNECGAGLHFSPLPHMALNYHDGEGQRFVACPVLAADLRPIGHAGHADKVKAPRVVAPGCYEVDIDGQPITTAASSASPTSAHVA